MVKGFQNAQESCEHGDVLRPTTSFRCLCCNGVIVSLFDQDVSGGLDLKMGFVFDEYSFICDNCAAALIAERTHSSAAMTKKVR
jgi:hypothetical protein